MAKREYLLGIDLGTTYLKACVFERDSGRAVAHGGVRLPVRTIGAGGREQDMPVVLRALQRIARRLQNAHPAAWARIAGTGVASQGGSSVIAARGGAPRTPMLLWNDARAYAHLADVLKLLPAPFWRKVALRDAPAHGLARILWLQKERPEAFDELRGDALHVGAGDFLYFTLTGVWRQEAGSAIQIGAYNAVAEKLDARPLNAVGLSLDSVPPLREGDTTSPLSVRGAALLGLRAGIPVAGPYIDQEAGYRCAAATTAAPLHASLGTAWVGNFQVDKRKAGYAPYQLVLPAPDRGKRLIVLPLLTGNAAWDWALREFAGGVNARALAKANALLESEPFPHAGLHFLPWSAQENPLLAGAYGGGAFVGMSTNTAREDFLSASALGLVCEFARVFAELRDKRIVKSVVLNGGASKSGYFRRLMASLLAPLPVLWQTDSDLAGARGALVAFDSGASRGVLKRVPLPGGRFHAEARQRAAEYNTIVERLYGHVRAGRPYTLR